MPKNKTDEKKPKLPYGVSLHKSGLYMARKMYKGHRYVEYGKTPPKAADALSEAINNAKRKEQPSNITVGDLGEALMSGKKKSVRGTTYNTIDGYYKKHIEPIKDTRVQKFDAQAWVDGLTKKGLAPTTVRKIWILMKQLLRAAVKKEIIRYVPDDISFPRIIKKKIEPLTAEQVGKLIAASAKSAYADIFLFALYTGLRKEEITPLKWSDCDFKNNKVTIRRTLIYDKGWKIVEEGKTDDSLRTIPINPELSKHINAMPRRCDFVFTGRHPRMVCPSSLQDSWVRIKKRAVVECRWHDLRHQFASDLRLQGVQLDVIQELLGHSSIITTRIYAHLAPSVPRAAVDGIIFLPSSGVKAGVKEKTAPPADAEDA